MPWISLRVTVLESLLSGARSTTVRFDPLVIASNSCLKLFYGGDILHATAFGKHIVVINSLKMAEEIFERRAQLYSDRPVIPIVEVYAFSSISRSRINPILVLAGTITLL
jgi:hypothetical protein